MSEDIFDIEQEEVEIASTEVYPTQAHTTRVQSRP